MVVVVFQLVAWQFAGALEARVEEKLSAHGAGSTGKLMEIVRDYSIRIEWVGSILPLLAVLAVTVVSLPEPNSTGLLIVLVLWIGAGIVSLFLGVAEVGAVGAVFTEATPARRLGIKSYASVLRLVYSVATIGVLVTVAILQLPVEQPLS